MMTEKIDAALLTGGFDKPYTFGLAMALSSREVWLDVIGGDDIDSPEMHATPKVTFFNLRGNKGDVSLARKILRVVIYYGRLIRYAAVAQPKIFHILWNNKFELFDRTLLMLYYRLLGKNIVFTAHNVNAGRRDSSNSKLNRVTLKVQYSLADHIFVHTEKMRSELLQDFGVPERAVSVIPFGINNSVPHTDLTSHEARKLLGIKPDEKTILFFGSIRPYKGLEYLVEAFQRLAVVHTEYRLIIAGLPMKGTEKYFEGIQKSIDQHESSRRVIQRIQFIPDEETELYFKAADVVALPYTEVYQSGVLFLAYSFGLPAIASDVGSIKDDMIEGKTGFQCKPCDSLDLARAIEEYFQSHLFKSLDHLRQEIRNYAQARHSWEVVGELTRNVYEELLKEKT